MAGIRRIRRAIFHAYRVYPGIVKKFPGRPIELERHMAATVQDRPGNASISNDEGLHLAFEAAYLGANSANTLNPFIAQGRIRRFFATILPTLQPGATPRAAPGRLTGPEDGRRS